jgi:hypothetical protein
MEVYSKIDENLRSQNKSTLYESVGYNDSLSLSTKVDKLNESFGIPKDDKYTSIFRMSDAAAMLLESKYGLNENSVLEENIYKETSKNKTNNMSNQEIQALYEHTDKNFKDLQQVIISLKKELELLKNSSVKESEDVNFKNIITALDKNFKTIEDEFSSLSETVNSTKKEAGLLKNYATKNFKTVQETYNKDWNILMQWGDGIVDEFNESYANTENKLDAVVKNLEYLTKYLQATINQVQYQNNILEHHIKFTDAIVEQNEYQNKMLEGLIKHHDVTVGLVNDMNEHKEELVNDINRFFEAQIKFNDYIVPHIEAGIKMNDYNIEVSEKLANYVDDVLRESIENTGGSVELIAERLNAKIGLAPIKEHLIKESLNSGDLSQTVSALLESANKKKATNREQIYETLYPFTSILSEAGKNSFSRLNETTKEKVVKIIQEKNLNSESDILRVIEAHNAIDGTRKPTWLEKAPEKYARMWENLSVNERASIRNRANLYDFKNQMQVNSFWESLNLKDSVISKLDKNSTLLKENEKVNKIDLIQKRNIDLLEEALAKIK